MLLTLKDYVQSIKHKKITVIGAGISNRPLIRLLCENGIDVCVRDRAETLHEDLRGLPLRTILGADYLQNLDGEIIFRTPGLHPDTPALKQAREQGSLVTSEMEVFLNLCPCKVLAVTGSDGKTTTTSLITELLKTAGYRVHLGGNIGQPLLCRRDEMGAEDLVVLELSSFQLHSMSCSPDVSLITNLAPNHLDVHPDYEDYVQAKKQIFLQQSPSALLVLNADNADTAACAAEAKGHIRYFSRKGSVAAGVFLDESGTLCLVRGGQTSPILPAGEIRIPGVHNIENMMAAFAAVADLVDVDTMRKVARSFLGVAHRLEPVRVLRGVTFINDSIASSPSRTIAGLSCFNEKLILIAGGKDKGVAFDDLGEVICRHVKSLYLTGLTAEKIRLATISAPNYCDNAPSIHIFEDFRECVEAAAREAQAGDSVLLSPASTSFDRFKDFEERGNTFRKIVEELP